jgi:Protein of unknown function (DUF3261)
MGLSRTSVVVLSLAALACACRGTMPPAQPILRSPASIQTDFFLRQEILAKHRGRSVKYQAALEKRGDVLRLVGLTPYGSPAFMVEQSGDQVRFIAYVDLDIPFDPAHMLVDVQRVLFAGSGIGSRLVDGVHEFESGDGKVVETWAAGSITSRVFFDSESTAEIARVEFQGALEPTFITCPTVILRDQTHKYEIEIRTVEQYPLSSVPPGTNAAGN